MNKVVLIGRLTKDIEVRAVGNTPKKVAEFSLACQTGKEPEFINCVAWDRTVEVLDQYTSKGSQIGVEGHLTIQKWQDQNGNNRQKMIVTCDRIELLGSKKTEQTEGEYKPLENHEEDTTKPLPVNEPIKRADISSDYLPFY